MPDKAGVKLLRLPSLLFSAGVVLLAASLLVWRLANADLLAWALLCGSFPLILEARTWWDASRVASLYYAVDAETVWTRAYDLRSAIPGFTVAYSWLLGIIIARETATALPDNAWLWVIFAGPMALWLALTFFACRRRVQAYVAANGISKRHARRWRNST